MSSENNAEILKQLQFICDKIEESINQYHENKEQETLLKQQEEILSYENNNSPSFIHQINSYKSQVETIQKDLEKVYNIDTINSLESQISQKERKLKELKNEKIILNKMVKEQNKGINEYLAKFDSTKDLKELQSNLKIAKEENHINKEIYKGISAKLKSQKSKIEQLEKRCLIIKQNIEFQKKKQLKEIQKNEKEQNQLENEDEDDTEKLTEIEKQLMEEINVQEKTYQNEINSQNDLMKKLRTDKNKIDFKVKNLNQEKKLEQIKKKEELKANKEKARNKSTNKLNRTNNNQKNNDENKPRNNKRGVSNYNSRRNNNENLITNINFKNKKNQNEINKMLLTPNFRIPKSGKYNKPFEIKKFNNNAHNNNIDNDGKYVTMFNESKKYRLDNPNSNNSNQSNKNIYQVDIKSNKEISSEIESLKNDIQNVLKNNVAIIDKIKNKEKEKENIFSNIDIGDKEKEINDEEINNENNINKNNYKKEYCLQNEVNSKQYKSDNNTINGKASEEIIKRKPFDKINFNHKL